MNTDSKPSHLIERAAARLSVPWGEALTPRVPAAATARLPERERAPQAAPTDLPAPDTPAPTPIPADALARAGLVDRTPRRSRVAEEFRIVRSKVLRAAFGGNGVAASPRGNLILVTSALAGEGKTFVATNLAAGLSRQGDRRVLLVDIDLKDDALSRLIGVSTAPGMLDLARTSHHRVEEFVIPTALENLDVLPLGTGVAESAELFASKRMAERLDDLSRRYADRPIIFDASPCLSNSIPHVIAPLVGQIIMVVAAGSTQQGDIEAALDMVQGCPNVSLLLNKMMPWNRRSFGAYAYGYSSSA